MIGGGWGIEPLPLLSGAVKAFEDHGMLVTVAPGSIQSARLNRLGGI
jgi:hypothetical protein